MRKTTGNLRRGGQVEGDEESSADSKHFLVQGTDEQGRCGCWWWLSFPVRLSFEAGADLTDGSELQVEVDCARGVGDNVLRRCL